MNKRFLMVVSLVLCLLMCLCACTNAPDETTEATNSEPSTAQTTAPTDEITEPTDDGKVTYTVTLVDTEGNPFANTMVQLCLESCFPSVTDENGVATFNLPEADYYASVSVMPEGYAYDSDAEKFYFENGSFDVTITLKTAE